jgi:hypothetical protein
MSVTAEIFLCSVSFASAMPVEDPTVPFFGDSDFLSGCAATIRSNALAHMIIGHVKACRFNL